MEWTGDVARGAWIAPRLEGWGLVGGTVPRGFDAYARVFHPVCLDRIARQEPTIESEERLVTWRWVTERFGTTWHPLMQWSSIARHLGEQYDVEDGWRLNDPEQGQLDLEALASLAAVLAEATTTPDDATAGIWHGWGELHPQQAGIMVAGRGSARQRRRLIRERRERLVEGVDPQILRAAERGPTLSLPHREYVLLAASVLEFAQPGWATTIRLGSGRSLTPNVLWPEDRAWFLGTEIDFDSTIIGGSRELVDVILATSGMEAAEVHADEPLTSDADTLNAPRSSDD